MKIKLTQYGHAIIIAVFGVMIITLSSSVLFNFFGGLIIGTALVLARNSKEE